MNLVGYLNRHRSYPAPLISVAQDGSDFYALFPSGDKVRLKDVHSREAIRMRDTYVALPEGSDTEVPQLAFGIAPQMIVAGDPKGVGRVLRTYVRRSGRMIDPDELASIKAFLLSIHEFTGKISARELIDVLNGRQRLVVKVVSRQLRRQHRTASTLLVQLTRQSSTRTLYRKGIPAGRGLADVAVPPWTLQFLQQDLFA